MVAMPGMYPAASPVLLPPPGLGHDVVRPSDLAAAEEREAEYNRLVQWQLERRHLLLLQQVQLQAALNFSLQTIQAPALSPRRGEAPRRSSIESTKSASTASTASGDAALDLSSEADEALTTVIMKKMPKAFTATMLLELLDSHGFHGNYDFLYTPVEFDRMVGTGCSFINFRSHQDALRFMSTFQGFHSWQVKCGGTKKADLSWSVGCQGRQAHIERYRNSPVMHAVVPEDLKPMLFDSQGQREAFPAPTEVLEPPRAFQL